jgi:hypothetical protein
MFSDGLVSWFFISLNFGVPIILIVLYRHSKIERNAYISGFAAIVPSLLFHMIITVDFHMNQYVGPDSFAYHAQWVMAGWVGPTFALASYILRRFLFKGLNKTFSIMLGFFPCALLYLGLHF